MDNDELKNYYKAIGERMCLGRRLRRKTQEDMAEVLNIVPSGIANYEAGIRKVPVHFLVKWAKLLQLPLDFFIRVEEDSLETEQICSWICPLRPPGRIKKEI